MIIDWEFASAVLPVENAEMMKCQGETRGRCPWTLDQKRLYPTWPASAILLPETLFFY